MKNIGCLSGHAIMSGSGTSAQVILIWFERPGLFGCGQKSPVKVSYIKKFQACKSGKNCVGVDDT